MRNQDGDGLPLRAEFRGLPAVPADQVVTGLIPHEPPHFQTPSALALLSDAVCVVTGQRGVGKTQVAAAYARQRVRDGWLVAWIGGETEEQIKAGMAELADRLSLYRPEDSAEVTAARVRNHLQARSGPALLVFDNVVSLDAIRPYSPSVGAAQVVITSTARGTQAGREVLVDVFDEETALRFLREATRLDDDGAAAELAQEVGYLPLALAQAAARMRAARWNYAKYLESFRKFPAERHLSRRDGDPYPLGAATAILMALEPFQDSELVQVLSVLSPDGVSREVLGDSADDELVRLHEASLVEFAGDSSVVMHRLVQRVIRDRGQDWAVWHAAKLLLDRSEVDGDHWAHRHLGVELVRQIEAVSSNTSPTAPQAVFKVVILLRLWAAHFLVDIADSPSAALIAEDVYERLGEEHQLASEARQAITRASGTLPDNAVHLMEEEYAGLREELGPRHPRTLRAAHHLAWRYKQLNRVEDTVSLLEQALESWQGSTEVFALAGELGVAYLAAGRAGDAVAVLEQALRVNMPPMESTSTDYTTEREPYSRTRTPWPRKHSGTTTPRWPSFAACLSRFGRTRS